MKKNGFRYLFFLTGVLLIPAVTGWVTDEPKYTLIKKEKEISLYYRWVTMPDNLRVREIRADLEIRSTPEKIIDALKNEQQAIQWMKGVSKINEVGESSENNWYAYILYDIPWPLNNQDCIIHYQLKKLAGKSISVTMKGVPAFIPENKGITRIKHLEGSWVINPVNHHLCKVIYKVYSGVPPQFPRWVSDPIIQDNLIQTMVSFKNIVEQKKN